MPKTLEEQVLADMMAGTGVFAGEEDDKDQFALGINKPKMGRTKETVLSQWEIDKAVAGLTEALFRMRLEGKASGEIADALMSEINRLSKEAVAQKLKAE